MGRNSDYEFVETDTANLVSEIVAKYEELTGTTLKPSSPESLMVNWVASVIVQERVLNNYTGNQNIPSRAEGENLDALGELFFGVTRPSATYAVSTVRFVISEAQSTSILIPKGTRVTDKSSTLYWETLEDAYVAIGETSADVRVQCTTAGAVGNGYSIGQLNTLVDVFEYYLSCSNITASDGGSDEADDEAFYEIMRQSMASRSTAGARGTYEYYAKAVSTEIADVVANTPSDGEVDIFALMDDGTAATTEMKAQILAACSADDVRPLTDYVVVADPSASTYNINITYYIPSDTTKSQTEMQADVTDAVNRYIAWQSAKFGRDINPDKLREYLFETGIKRVVVTAPVFTVLSNGRDNSTPEYASVGTINIVNGGYEDE